VRVNLDDLAATRISEAASPAVDDHLLDDTAVEAFGRQVRGLIVEPPTAALALDLPKILGVVQQLLHPDVWIAGILVEEAAAVGGQTNHGKGQEKELAAHISPPCERICFVTLNIGNAVTPLEFAAIDSTGIAGRKPAKMGAMELPMSPIFSKFRG